MKKTVSLLTGFLLIIISLHAQEKQSKFLVELGVGPSLPIGKFASTTDDPNILYSNNKSGYAKPGLGVQLSLGYYLNKSIGLLLLPGYTEHLYNEQTSGNQIRIDAQNWKTVKLMAGGFVMLPLAADRKLALLTTLTAGVAKTAVPKYTSLSFYNTSVRYYEREKISLPWSFCYQASVGLQYKFNRKWFGLLDINAFNSIARHKWTVTDKYKQSTISATAGIGMNL